MCCGRSVIIPSGWMKPDADHSCCKQQALMYSSQLGFQTNSFSVFVLKQKTTCFFGFSDLVLKQNNQRTNHTRIVWSGDTRAEEGTREDATWRERPEHLYAVRYVLKTLKRRILIQH